VVQATDGQAAGLDALRATPRRLEALLHGLPRAETLWTPAPGKWCILEVVCHLRDHEEVAQASYRRIVAGDEPVLAAADADFRALLGLYREQRLSEALRDWKRRRRELLEFLDGLADDDWGRGGTRAEDGEPALADWVARHAAHDQRHLKQIEAIQERRAILQRLEAAPRELRAVLETWSLLRPAPSCGAGAAPAGVLDEVAALRDFEHRTLVRYALILEQDRPALRPLDADPLPPRRGAAGLGETWREFERLRSLALELLHALGPRLWQRRGVHPRRGDLTIAELVAQHVDHDATRLAALRALAGRCAAGVHVPPGASPSTAGGRAA
jgi:hypothetical protein